MPTDNESDLTPEPMDEPARPTLGQPALPLSKPALEFGRLPDSIVKRSPRSKPTPAAPVDEDRVGDYRHPDASRTPGSASRGHCGAGWTRMPS